MGRVVLKLRHRQLAPHAPGVENKRIGVEDRVAVGKPFAAGQHTIDLFQYQTGETISDCYAVQGPIHPQLGIAMDMGIVAKVPAGSILTLSLSFTNDGPLGSFFRYICDNGTYKAFYDDLSDGKDNKIDEIGRASCRERVSSPV